MDHSEMPKRAPPPPAAEETEEPPSTPISASAEDYGEIAELSFSSFQPASPPPPLPTINVDAVQTLMQTTCQPLLDYISKLTNSYNTITETMVGNAEKAEKYVKETQARHRKMCVHGAEAREAVTKLSEEVKKLKTQAVAPETLTNYEAQLRAKSDEIMKLKHQLADCEAKLVQEISRANEQSTRAERVAETLANFKSLMSRVHQEIELNL